jgi:hypothetical protein
VVAEIDLVEVQPKDFLFAEVVCEAEREEDFTDFANVGLLVAQEVIAGE